MILLFSQIILVIVLLAMMFRRGWGREIFGYVGQHALTIGLIVSLVSVIGSLFYSNVLGYEPCLLCWWLRVLLYPLVVIFGVSLWKRYTNAFSFAMPLAIMALAISAYFTYTSLGGSSLIACTSTEGGCSKVFVRAFGFITIPTMALTISLYIILLGWINKLYRNENSHA